MVMTAIRGRALPLALICVLLGTSHVAAEKVREVHGFTDPDYAGVSFASVVVSAPDMTLDKRREVENLVVEALKQKGLAAIGAMDVVPPTKEDDVVVRNELLKQSNHQATLLLEMKTIYFEYDREPMRGTTHGRFMLDDAGRRVADPNAWVSVQGGELHAEPEGIFTLRLISNDTAQTVWKGSIFISGSYKNGLSVAALLNGVEELHKLGLLKQAAP